MKEYPSCGCFHNCDTLLLAPGYLRSLRGQNLRDAEKNPSANVILCILQNSGQENEIY